MNIIEAIAFASLVVAGFFSASKAFSSTFITTLLGIMSAFGAIALRNILLGESWKTLINIGYVKAAGLGALTYIIGSMLFLSPEVVILFTFSVMIAFKIWNTGSLLKKVSYKKLHRM